MELPIFDGMIDCEPKFELSAEDLKRRLFTFLDHLESSQGVLFHRFVVRFHEIQEVLPLLADLGIFEGFPVLLRGYAHGTRAIDAAFSEAKAGGLSVEGYCLHLMPGLISKATFLEVKQSAAYRELDDAFQICFSNDSFLLENIHEAATVLENVGFCRDLNFDEKSEGPSVSEVADWIAATASLQSTVGFSGISPCVLTGTTPETAFGVANVLVATILSDLLELSTLEISSVLQWSASSQFGFGAQSLRYQNEEVPWTVLEEALGRISGLGVSDLQSLKQSFLSQNWAE